MERYAIILICSSILVISTLTFRSKPETSPHEEVLTTRTLTFDDVHINLTD